ncbi:class I SAM-dependent methyltransferase [Leptospira noguchii]|uniref:class I SAM-dependent methyltransferase n=1 Tax=Leptospira noguchii TaxID=28182 RepID=UPI001FB5B993|nr:class I SAM-dependent methyltransferase [Leptospira noguchii]UOG35411.1 class I SAM-dependent methyltransferase [Leptospira noguchii]UOG46329.1 class I SAM-dependent methyltransferase [Leptospira noguchii]
MSKWSQVTKNAVERYNNRYEKLGKDVKSLGWGDKKQQIYRFEQVLSNVDLINKNILDIGCGFSDFLSYIQEKNIMFSKYTGWDINKKFLNENKILENHFVTFENQDISNLQESDLVELKKANHQVLLMLGLLNFRLNEGEMNYEYSFDLIRNAFAITSEMLVVDFLSSKIIDQYPKENFVFYHSPSKVLDFALEITPNVILKHNYVPIPQKEFMLFLYK